MPLQDLTPQLRTRLNRMERAVGWFILLATLLLLFGFGYYIYNTAERRGWFKIKAGYYTYADSGAGLAPGDPVTLLGFPAGQILRIVPMPPSHGAGSGHNVYIEFEIAEPNFGYLWTEGSRAKLNSGFLEKRQLEVTKGTSGYSIYIRNQVKEMPLDQVRDLPDPAKWRLGQELYNGTNLVSKAWQHLAPELLQKAASLGLTNLWLINTNNTGRSLGGVWNEQAHHYDEYSKTGHHLYELPQDEQPALNDRLQAVATQIENALPNFLALTNPINAVLSNSARLTSNLNVVAENLQPTMTNVAVITAQLRNPDGSLGQWLIPTNLNQQLDNTLRSANHTITDADTNLVAIMESLGRSLDNLAGITSNLNNQVQFNSNILANISDIIVHSDEFVQGLKRHWLLRSAFKTPKTNAPAGESNPPSTILRSPRAKDGAP